MSRGKTATTRGWRDGGALASALLMSAAMTACVNPLFFDNVQAAVNHAPVVVNMQPQPTFGRIEVNVGENCAPDETFRAERLEDADFDVLTVRYSLLLPRGVGGSKRETVLEQELVPFDEPIEGRLYDFQPFQLDGSRLNILLGGDVGEQVDRPEGQLLELRISDGGFKAGTDDVPEGAGLFYMSWAIKLTRVDCVAP